MAPAMIKILLAVDIFDQSNPPDCDMQAPFWAPRAARGSSSRGYRTPSLVRSQMPTALVSRALLAAKIDVPHAIAPATTANHGPSQGREKAGGNSTESREATTTSAPRLAIATSHLGSRSRERNRAAVMTSPPIAASAATRDQWPLRVQAPNASEPGPNRLHGSAVARTARPKAAIANVLAPRSGRGELASVVSPASGPKTPARHSLPKFSPRTGVEHARHIGRPHPSHRARTRVTYGPVTELVSIAYVRARERDRINEPTSETAGPMERLHKNRSLAMEPSRSCD